MQAQNIVVLNKNTKEPIVGVAIFNTSKSTSVVTDFYGKANLDNFKSAETVNFKHLSYNTFFITKSAIKKARVFLQPKAQGLDEIVISGSKFKESKRDIPKKIISVRSKDITFQNPQTSADLLTAAGQVYIQ